MAARPGEGEKLSSAVLRTLHSKLMSDLGQLNTSLGDAYDQAASMDKVISSRSKDGDAERKAAPAAGRAVDDSYYEATAVDSVSAMEVKESDVTRATKAERQRTRPKLGDTPTSGGGGGEGGGRLPRRPTAFTARTPSAAEGHGLAEDFAEFDASAPGSDLWYDGTVTWRTAPEAAKEMRKGRPIRWDAFSLRVVYERGRTGFEAHKSFTAPEKTLIAGRFLVKEWLGSAAFSSALSCIDLISGEPCCLKVIKNNKDYLDQSLDEIKLLHYINSMGDPDEHHVLRMYEYFYHKEHLFIVTELLKDNLYEFQKYLADGGHPSYFTMGRLQSISKQALKALTFVHNSNLVHCDLKPENILIKSYSKCEIKVIDFGSSCFVTDHLSSYLQSRSYRAPEVILGLPYAQKIDMWSLGCILAELWTGRVLFHNDSIQTMLARMQGVIGEFPAHMLQQGMDVPKYFTSKGVVYEKSADGSGYVLLQPRRSSLSARLRGADPGFINFVEELLRIDPDKRLSAKEALAHPWLQQEYETPMYVMP